MKWLLYAIGIILVPVGALVFNDAFEDIYYQRQGPVWPAVFVGSVIFAVSGMCVWRGATL